MGPSQNFSARAEPSYEGSEPSCGTSISEQEGMKYILNTMYLKFVQGLNHRDVICTRVDVTLRSLLNELACFTKMSDFGSRERRVNK